MPIAKSNGIEIDYEVEGEGEPLVLIMGFGAQRIVWPRELIDQLVHAGFRVITFDNRDVGGSTKLNHLGIPDVRKTLVRSLLGLPVIRQPAAPGRTAGGNLLGAAPIPHKHNARWQRRRFDQRQVQALALREYPLAAAQHKGIDVQGVLVDQVVRGQRLD